MREPFFSCQKQACAEESSFSEGDLRIHDGEPICQYCYEEEFFGENVSIWHDLPPFTFTHGPSYRRAIEDAAKVCDEMVNTTDSPADRHLVEAAIKIRALPEKGQGDDV